jgi:hypothetical protein
VEQLCRSGKLTPRARIFLPDEDRWATIEETRLATELNTGSPGAGTEESESRAGIEAEYKQALERIETEPDLLEAHLDAGILADELGQRDEARAHFQTVLHRYPYHARAAAEVHRRFNKVEQKKIRYLDRPLPVWEDILDLARIPFGRGPLYVMLPTLAFGALSFVTGWMGRLGRHCIPVGVPGDGVHGTRRCEAAGLEPLVQGSMEENCCDPRS